MAERGVGLVDIFLDGQVVPDEPIRVARRTDGARRDAAADRTRSYGDLYAVAAGDYDVGNERCSTPTDPDSGGFYLIEQQPGARLPLIVGSLPLPCQSHRDRRHTRLPGGRQRGRDHRRHLRPAQPARRRARERHRHRLRRRGSTATRCTSRSARKGIATVDVTNPQTAGGQRRHGGVRQATTSAPWSRPATPAIGGGAIPGQLATRVRSGQPGRRAARCPASSPRTASSTTTRSAGWRSRLRFNKAIDCWPDNLARFRCSDADGAELPAAVEIVDNDAMLTLPPATAWRSATKLTVVARKGVASVKPSTRPRR